MRGPLTDVDAIYFDDGSAIKIPDGSIFIVTRCDALKKYNETKPILNGAGPYTVKLLPDAAAQEKEFGPIERSKCQCK